MTHSNPDGRDLRSLSEVLEEFPKLTLYGYGAPRDQPFEPWRKELVEADETRVRACALWLLEHIEPTRTINKRLPTSYGLKHRYEDATGAYIENGLFIAAAICAGFDFDHGDVNVQFNMSKRSWAPYAPDRVRSARGA